MKLVIKARNIKMTPALEHYVHDKLVHPARRLYDSAAARMEVQIAQEDDGRARCAVRFSMPGEEPITVSTQAEHAHEAIDCTEDRLLTQIKRRRSCSRSRSRDRRHIRWSRRSHPHPQMRAPRWDVGETYDH